MVQVMGAVVSKRRQITLPAEVCQRLGIKAGDQLDLILDGESIVLRGKTATTRGALNVLKRAFGASGTAEDAPRQAARVACRRRVRSKK